MTPETGNCQPYAIVEALLQQDIKLLTKHDYVEGLTMLLKYGMLLAHKTASAADLRDNIISILDFPQDKPVDMPLDEQMRLVTKFYEDLAVSASALSTVLPERLWGRFDTLRMASKLLNRTIFLISKSADPTNCYLNVIRMQRTNKGEDHAALLQPGVEDWLDMLEDDCKLTGRAPLVLYHTGNHYNFVIYDRTRPATAAQPTKKLKTAKLNDFWKPDNEAPGKPSEKLAPSVSTTSRGEVLASSVRLDEADLLDFLVDPAWTSAEKEEIVRILVAEDPNFNERLRRIPQEVTSPPSSESYTPLSPEPVDASARDSDGEYFPSQSSSDAIPASQGSSLASQGMAAYREWADGLLRTVQDEWLAQYNEQVPDLTQTEELLKFMRRHPTRLWEAGSWCGNPLVLLEHIEPKHIKQWMLADWVSHCDRVLASAVEEVMDAEARSILDEWVKSIREALSAAVGHSLLRNKWGLLEQHAPRAVSAPHAGPLLTWDYKEINANVLAALNRLFPEMAERILIMDHWPGDRSAATLTLPMRRGPGSEQ